jgi:hypothetical protein
MENGKWKMENGKCTMVIVEPQHAAALLYDHPYTDCGYY